jgi:hypothetical protein
MVGEQHFAFVFGGLAPVVDIECCSERCFAEFVLIHYAVQLLVAPVKNRNIIKKRVKKKKEKRKKKKSN